MARQKGIIKLKGTMGDITFYRTSDGYMAREKGGISAERMRTDPAFQRTRENMAEFGRAGKAGKVLRGSLQKLVATASDRRMVSRLTKEMVTVIQMDAVNPRGQRNVIDGEAELLTGFDFNISGKLSTTLLVPYESSLVRATGEATVSIPAYDPQISIAGPAGSTHYQIVSGAASVDFEKERFKSSTTNTDILPIDGVTTVPMELENVIPINSTHPLFMVLGISFYQEVNGTYYPLKNGSFNALQIIEVSGL